MTDRPVQPRRIGIYNLNMAARGGGEKLTLVLASHLSRTHDVQLFHVGELDTKSFEETFAVDLSRVRFTQLAPVKSTFRSLEKIGGPRTSPFWLHHYRQLKRLNLDLFINVSHGSVLPCPAAKGMFICMFPHRFNQERVNDALRNRIGRRLVDGIESTLAGANERTWLGSYTRVIAISRFAADWVERLWHRESQVIYPPVDDMGSGGKAQMILHVGRFTRSSANNHHKAQEVLLAAFKKITQSQRNGWELHLAGNVGSDSGSAQFADSLVQKAVGLPVRFHFDAKFDELRELYRQAAIYWHATGVGTDAREHPELQEHFGITTVEAMSAGAVPVVIRSGGQTEIVTEGVDGMCWNNIDEMLAQTELLMSDVELRERLRTNAVESSRRFGRGAFTAQMDRSIAEVLN